MKIILLLIAMFSANSYAITLSSQQVAAASVICSLYYEKIKDVKRSVLHMNIALTYYNNDQIKK